MIKTVNRNEFYDEMMSIRPDNFSPAGLSALFEYLVSCEEDASKQIEFDPIALCCEYTEDTIESTLANYSLESIDNLRDHTTVIDVDDETIIIQDF